jgi:ubiquinone/menaquinone biosynthesis C-methylase UbiE
MQNAFGLPIPTIKEIIIDLNVKSTVSDMLLDVLTYLDLPSSKAKTLIDQCLQAAKDYSELEAYEEVAHNILSAEQVVQRIPQKLTERAALMYSQIAPYLLPGNLLDYGCGDGQVSELIAKNRSLQVTLTDVYEHRHVNETGLPFTPFKQGQKTPFPDTAFENVLALTVFHHSSNPVESIKDVSRLTKKGGRVLVVESVYGVDGKQLSHEMQKKITKYLLLSAEQQRIVNVFFDHFYNRILFYNPNPGTKVNVPFNFNTPENWKGLFAQEGLEQEHIVHLGLDQLLAPEYHTLHVLRKR